MVDATPRFGAVVVAAGAGRRFAADGIRKQYRELCGKPLLLWSLDVFLAHPAIVASAVVLPAEDVDHPPDWLLELPVVRIAGGAERADSVRNGIQALERVADAVLVHDGARPLVSRGLLDRLISAAAIGSVVPGVRVTDTLKQVDEGGLIEGTADRERLRAVQTPQAFPTRLLLECHRRAAEEGFRPTDDAALLERYGFPVRVVEGDPMNIKVTTPHDFVLAELLARRLPPTEDSKDRVADPTS